MKKMIFALLIITSIVRCTKETDKINSNLNNKVKENNRADMELYNYADTVPLTILSNFLPCEYYPPTDWRSCNYSGGTTEDFPTETPITTNAVLTNGILSFPTVSDFLSTMDQLDEADENYTGYAPYMNFYNGNLDRIDSLLDAKGIDESSTFINFENRFSGYYSMRKDIESQESNFLNNGGDPASNLNPENMNIFSDDIFRTLLNKEGAIRIENIIFKFFYNGVCYAIMNNDINLYNKLSHPENYSTTSGYHPDYYATHFFGLDTSNVKLLTPYLLCSSGSSQIASTDPAYPCLGNYPGARVMGANCKLWYRIKSNPTYINNNKYMFISKVAVYNSFVYDVGLSKIRSYKKKNNGKWKPVRTNLSAFVKEYGCSDYSKNKTTKYRKFRRAAKRDMATIIPGLGQLFQGIEWMFKNMLGNTNNFDNGYYRYFKTATNNGSFYGENYCNGNKHLLKSQW